MASISNFTTGDVCASTKLVQIIGISGATRSGKSTLQRTLYDLLKTDGGTNVMKLSQDHFFRYHCELITPSGEANWDQPFAIKWDTLYAQILKMREELSKTLGRTGKEGIKVTKCVLILEGFMLFYESRLRNLFDFMIWLEINRPTCHDRRMETYRVTEDYFNTKLWVNYTSYRTLLFDELRISVHSIDGTLSPEIVANKAATIIEIKS